MKGTDHFKQTIQKYLEDRAAADPLFAATYAKPNKNIEGCLDYIFATVQKSGFNGFTDDEVFNMAVHYYDEDDINPGKTDKSLRVVVNHAVELTEEEKVALQDKAHKEAEQEYLRSLKKKAIREVAKKPVAPVAEKKQPEKKQKVQLPSLFDL
ncbi:MAG: PcfK-like family protein [Mangrovibacterium sp.]